MKFRHFLLLLLLTAAGCGPGVTDGEYPITEGYVFTDTGGNGKAIEHDDRQGLNEIVIQPRVDSYFVENNRIIVARRPAETVKRGTITDRKLSSRCEYWVIDTEAHIVERIADASKWPSVQCDMGKTYGAMVESGQ